MSAHIVSVAKRKRHGVGKDAVDAIELIAGQGVSGDAHCGAKVKHRSRARFNPSLPNLRQVHLLHAELLEELVARGFAIVPAQMGENVTTRGIDLLSLPAGTRLALGKSAIVELTGLRNPCIQLERMMPGLMQACLDQGADGALIRKAGVMAVVVTDGLVRSGDVVTVTLPAGAHQALKPV
jgi:MOSC domain-containing protein YiiM